MYHSNVYIPILYKNTDNCTAIKTIKESNDILKEENSTLNNEVKFLKKEINNLQQYLRVDNVEVVGLPHPDDESSDESNLLELFNSLDHESDRNFVQSDIDICHPIPTNRKDGRRVVVCKFSSRKHKIAVLKAKKSKRDLKLNDNIIFINEHLSPENRKLFAAASEKKRELHYKYLWTRNGTIYIRKSDTSDIINIT